MDSFVKKIYFCQNNMNNLTDYWQKNLYKINDES